MNCRGRLASLFRTFERDARGSVALMFGFLAIVLVGVAGVAFDYSRMALVQTGLQRAVDAAALLVARNREQVGNYAMPDALATSYLKNTFDVDQLTDLVVKVTLSEDRVRVDAAGNLKMTLSNVIGVNKRPVSSSAEALFGDNKLELALVLDNTGSMSALNKLETLKAAAHRFVDKMQAGNMQPGALKIALVPFDTNVNLGALRTSSWVDSASQTFWTNDPSKAGCVWDRDQPHDALDTPPNAGATAFSADTSRSAPCSLAPIMPLTQDFGALHNAISGMVASGNTNTTIGLAWGYHVLTRSEPVTNAAPSNTKNLSKYIVFMTDGDNTQNRWSKSQTEIDARTRRVCDSVKADKIQVFTARIIEGNASLLRECATSPDMYFDVQDMSQLDPVFDKIQKLISGTRIAR
ncbi:VWA domain-containing protein [uncultured Enterovirga sp.]|uniref:vWA domain-containing protein n=1 Tax=uncultured Enterovirga sp. TaxID=2026352 RepID=UPI0035CC1A08